MIFSLILPSMLLVGVVRGGAEAGGSAQLRQLVKA